MRTPVCDNNTSLGASAVTKEIVLLFLELKSPGNRVAQAGRRVSGAT